MEDSKNFLRLNFQISSGLNLKQACEDDQDPEVKHPIEGYSNTGQAHSGQFKVVVKTPTYPFCGKPCSQLLKSFDLSSHV